MTRNEELRVIKTALELTRQLSSKQSEIGGLSALLGDLLFSSATRYAKNNAKPNPPKPPERKQVSPIPYNEMQPTISINPTLTIGMLFMPVALLIAILFVAVLTKNDVSYAIVWIFVVLEVISCCIWYFVLYRPAKQIGIEKMLKSREYIEDRRRVDELNAKAVQNAESDYQMRLREYEEKLKEYNEVLIPEYERMLAEREAEQRKRDEDEDRTRQECAALESKLKSLYDSTKIVPVQYRNESALAFIYDVMSSSNISLVDAILMYDNAIQRDLDAQRVEAQMRTNDLLDEQNELLYRRNQIIHDHLRR